MRRIFKNDKNKKRRTRQARVRAKISGTEKRPRISVFRGNRNMNVQLIDDKSKKTIAAVNTNSVKDGDAKDRKGKEAKADKAFYDDSGEFLTLTGNAELKKKDKFLP